MNTVIVIIIITIIIKCTDKITFNNLKVIIVTNLLWSSPGFGFSTGILTVRQLYGKMSLYLFYQHDCDVDADDSMDFVITWIL